MFAARGLGHPASLRCRQDEFSSAENFIRHQFINLNNSTVLCKEIHLFKDMT